MKMFQPQGYYFRVAAIATLIAGMYLHITSLFIGRDLLRQYILTPTFDMLLAVPMTYAGIVGWLSWKQVSFDSGWKKFFYGFILVYFTISIPIHVQTYLTQSTAYINVFPDWYSYVILVLMTVMLLFVRNLSYKAQP
jgi:ABC-type spermidine/putrescine transport system permease subunit II